MLRTKLFKKNNLTKKKNSIFQKIILNGKSYKLYKKPNIIYFRFNKKNKDLLIYKNIFIKNKNLQKCIYMWPFYTPKQITILNTIFKNIRPYNTFTMRGLHPKNKYFYKRTGRISGYV